MKRFLFIAIIGTLFLGCEFKYKDDTFVGQYTIEKAEKDSKTTEEGAKDLGEVVFNGDSCSIKFLGKIGTDKYDMKIAIPNIKTFVFTEVATHKNLSLSGFSTAEFKKYEYDSEGAIKDFSIMGITEKQREFGNLVFSLEKESGNITMDAYGIIFTVKKKK